MSFSFSADKLKVNIEADIESLVDKDSKVCVVAIIGKSKLCDFRSKATLLNGLVKADIFGPANKNKWCTYDDTCRLECYYHKEANVVYVHLESHWDANIYAALAGKLTDDPNPQQDFRSIIRSSDHRHTKALMMIFSIAHVVLISSPSNSFDISYLRLFKTLDIIRLKMLPIVSECLKRLPISKDWVAAGRPCSPRVLFVFESCNLSRSTISETSNESSNNRNQDQNGTFFKINLGGVLLKSHIPLCDNNKNEQLMKVSLPDGTLKLSPIRVLQHSIEDQIYRILRKSRIVTNISNNSLFAVPQNQEFVFIPWPPPSRSSCNPVESHLNHLSISCVQSATQGTAGGSSKSRGYTANRRATVVKSGSTPEKDEAVTANGSAAVQLSRSMISSQSGTSFLVASEDSRFKEFLGQHTEMALTKGFEDNVGRNPPPALFELPTLKSFIMVLNKLHGLFWSETQDPKAQAVFTTMKGMLDIDLKFSEGHCSKILPAAESAYQEGLPSHYTTAYHLNKLQQAKQIFLHNARGPATNKYLDQLVTNCDKFWKNGHQMCEEVSLLGNQCINELHRLPDMPDMDETKHLPVMSHSSQVKTKAACNCGRRQTEREDPFEHRSANYEFYLKLEQLCCAKLEHYEMSVFKPSTSEARAAEPISAPSLVVPSSLLEEVRSPRHAMRKDSSKCEIGVNMSSLSLALSLGQSGGSDIFHEDHEEELHAYTSNEEDAVAKVEEEGDEDDGHDDEEEEDDDDDDDDEEEEEEEEEPDADDHDADHADVVGLPLATIRQHSTTEYLPGMLHSDSLPGLLPKFSSWSLVCLGKYNAYNSTTGVEQPGFLHSTNFLLPIDVTIQATSDKDKWPLTLEGTSKKIKSKKLVKENPQVVLRLYIGMEYECPRGHRFFLSMPEKMFKAPANGVFKETGHKVVNHDMPLYFPCTCRTTNFYMAQLMRIHVVVPEGNIEVKLKPKVQPGPLPCPIFFPEPSECLVLKPGVWVLRLPYVYLGENGPYLMPTDSQLSCCRFIKGFLTVLESSKPE